MSFWGGVRPRIMLSLRDGSSSALRLPLHAPFLQPHHGSGINSTIIQCPPYDGRWSRCGNTAKAPAS